MHISYVENLSLKNYRNFANFETNLSKEPVIIIGKNGSGKTNILESLSLLYPGRGLRSASLQDICQQDANSSFIKAVIHGKIGPASLTTEINAITAKRSSCFNGSKIANSELSRFATILWLTPQMDGIFGGGTSQRRKLLDRIVFSFIPAHAGIVAQYEHYASQRLRALRQEYLDANWLKAVESKMTELAIQLASNRVVILQSLQSEIDALDSEFPKSLISVDGFIENKIAQNLTVDVEMIKNEFLLSRLRDRVSGQTKFGPCRSEFVVIHKNKNRLAKTCSTGEQKAMLVSLMIAQISYCLKEQNLTPLVLLDEIFVHLDEIRRNALIELFNSLKLQFWITSTDLASMPDLALKYQIIQL